MKKTNSQPRKIVRQLVLASLLAFPLLGTGVAHAESKNFISRIVDAITYNGPSYSFETSSSDRHLRVVIKGTLKLTPNEDDIVSVSHKVSIRENVQGITRRIAFELESNGEMKRTYAVNGKQQTFDADGKRWLAAMLPSAMRETGFNSDVRIKRIYAAGGSDAVLAEISLIQNNTSRARYIDGLSKLTPADEKTLPKLLAALTPIDSDYERKNVLHSIIKNYPLNTESQIGILNQVANMSSNFEMRHVLVALIPKLSPEPKVSEAWLAAIQKIDSDFEARAVIDALTNRSAMTESELNLAIQSSLQLDSDFERASALKSMIKHLASSSYTANAGNYAQSTSQSTSQLLNDFLASAQKIDSDFEKRNVLVALASKVALGKNGFSALLKTLDSMDSDFEKSQVLTSVAKKIPADSELIAQYRKIARTLADFERGQAEKALDYLNM